MTNKTLVLQDILRRAAQDTRQQEKRIAAIFGKKEIPKVNEGTLAIYFDYLKQHLEIPCHLTEIEDRGCFSWEEYYRFNPDREEEYGERKKKEASYTDAYELLNFEDEYDTYAGLAVKVKRVPGRKRFVLPLVDLKATEQQSQNYQLLDDYTIWVVNWR
ncbi:MAG: hypothetical protein O7G88_22520 [bacterium]|nr:hypothetical protein [bacterium]